MKSNRRKKTETLSTKEKLHLKRCGFSITGNIIKRSGYVHSVQEAKAFCKECFKLLGVL